ncbi:rRNA pseudouridine synthase [Candidatus Peregrinibacteria bacterium]|nr:rRNA pseudouridine synthase [Candidatus Peregrinibacteria bacterium]
MLIRLHKYLADHGVASRRKCEEYIRQGLVKVNGKTVTEMGFKIDPQKDHIETDKKLQLKKQQSVYYIFHKPVGYVCTVTGKEEPKITELLKNIPERIFPVGRLDKLTSGLLLLTNDGRFAYEMTHPKFKQEKEYVVKIRETVTYSMLQELKKSISIHGRKTQPATVTLQAPHVVRMILYEGRNRQIRRLCQRAGIHIEKLKRIRIGPLELGNLQAREYRKLTFREIALLRK